MPDDREKPKVTLSSNSNEPSANQGYWSALDGKPLWSPPNFEQTPQLGDRYPRSALWQEIAQIAEKTYGAETTEPEVERAAMLASQSANPMHPRDRRFYLAVAIATIAAGLAVSCFLAGASGQLAWTWVIGGIVVGLGVTVLAAFDALDKPILSIRYSSSILTAVVTLTWLLIGWQTWITFYPQVYAKAQPDAEALDTRPFGGKFDGITKRATSGAQVLVAPRQPVVQDPPPRPYSQQVGVTCAYNLLATANAFWSRAPRGTAVLITGAQENAQLTYNLSATFSLKSAELTKSTKIDYPVITGGPNNSVDMDAPRLIPSDQNGIIIHGGDPQDILRSSWGYYFLIRRTSKVPDGLAEYYKVPSIVWIEVGPGNPWTNPTACSAG